MKVLVLALFLFFGIFQAFASDDFTKEFIEKEIRTVQDLLPSNYLEKVNKKIKWEVRPFKTDVNILDDLCKTTGEKNKKRIFAYVRPQINGGFKLILSEALVQQAQRNFKQFSCYHKNYQETLRATLIHEFTHMKDIKENISLDPYFQLLVGVRHVTKNPYKAVFNKNFMTSPNPYEFSSLIEALAVNTEFFVLDPNYECRRPALARFLSRKLGIFLQHKCKMNYNIMLQSRFTEDNFKKIVSLDPTLIYQVHYLFAGKGNSFKTKWGHAMIRLVVCSPNRRKKDPHYIPGPECMKDKDFHLVLNYRASMSRINVSYIGAVAGAYPILLFINSFYEIQDEYNKKDFRDLHSVPINLSRSQIEDFIYITLERYWNYVGKYYFFDNNCGTEIKKHVDFVMDKKQRKGISSLTPKSMYKDFLALDNSKIEKIDKIELQKQGLFFPSSLVELEGIFKKFKGFGLFVNIQAKDFISFSLQTQAVERLEEYKNILYPIFQKASPLEKKDIIMQMRSFESYLTFLFNRLSSEGLEKVTTQDELDLMEENHSWNKTPWQLIKSEYGNPLPEEWNQQITSFQELRNEDARLLKEMMSNMFKTDESKILEDLRIESDALKQIGQLQKEWLFEGFTPVRKN